MREVRYVLRDLPGIAELEDLLRRIEAEKNPEWTPLADGLGDKIARLSRSLFGITDQDTDDPPASYRTDIIGEHDRWIAWSREFYDEDFNGPDFAELSWDLNDAAGIELRCAEHFYDQIICSSKGLMGRLPDAPKSDAEIAKSTQDWAQKLQAEASKFRSKR